MVKLGGPFGEKRGKPAPAEDGFDTIPLITPLDVGQLQFPPPDKVQERQRRGEPPPGLPRVSGLEGGREAGASPPGRASARLPASSRPAPLAPLEGGPGARRCRTRNPSGHAALPSLESRQGIPGGRRRRAPSRGTEDGWVPSALGPAPFAGKPGPITAKPDSPPSLEEFPRDDFSGECSVRSRLLFFKKRLFFITWLNIFPFVSSVVLLFLFPCQLKNNYTFKINTVGE